MTQKDNKTFNLKDAVTLVLIYVVGIQAVLPVILIPAIKLFNKDISSGLEPGVIPIELLPSLQFFVFLIGTLILLFLTRHKLLNELKKFLTNASANVLKVLRNYGLSMLASIAINIVLVYVFKMTESSDNQQMVESMVNDLPLAMLAVTVLFAPLIEEIVFRGGLYLGVKSKVGELWAVLISSVSFGAIHVVVQVAQSGNIIDLLYILPYASMGFFMVKSVKDTDSLWGGILIHFINNLIATLIIIL